MVARHNEPRLNALLAFHIAGDNVMKNDMEIANIFEGEDDDEGYDEDDKALPMIVMEQVCKAVNRLVLSKSFCIVSKELVLPRIPFPILKLCWKENEDNMAEKIDEFFDNFIAQYGCVIENEQLGPLLFAWMNNDIDKETHRDEESEQKMLHLIDEMKNAFVELSVLHY